MTDATHLRELYPAPNERAVRKQLDLLDIHCRRFIELSPFLVMASVAAGTDGPLDASPRGGAPGFVKALDATTLLVPDAPGNNRLDSLSNIVATVLPASAATDNSGFTSARSQLDSAGKASLMKARSRARKTT